MRFAWCSMSSAKVLASGIIDGDLGFVERLTEIWIFYGAVNNQVDLAVEELLEVFEESEVGVGFAGSSEGVVVDQKVDIAGVRVEVADGCGAEEF